MEEKRSRFEKWARAELTDDLEYDDSLMCYTDRSTDSAWEGWRAALEDRQEAAPEDYARYKHALEVIGCNSRDTKSADVAVLALYPAKVGVPSEATPSPKWQRLPDEQTWWWHWNGEDLSVPHIYCIMVSKTGQDRYFIAHPDSRWCDEMGGAWLKLERPNVPERGISRPSVSEDRQEAAPTVRS